MRPSEHQIEFDRLLQSMPNEELASELMRLASFHDTSLEAVDYRKKIELEYNVFNN